MNKVVPVAAPFPWFGGKKIVAKEVWDRFGTVDNYVEPFFGSGAVLLQNTYIPACETINDKDNFVVNFWRAVRASPQEVAAHADSPVNEVDLQSKHYWLVTEGVKSIANCAVSPTYYDAQVAGWWLWGLCCWIGSGWCDGNGPWKVDRGVWVKRPHLGDAGNGINKNRPHLGDAGNGINKNLPHLGNAVTRREFISHWMVELSLRLRDVRVCCGDWKRVCTNAALGYGSCSAVFLDPPYSVKDRAYLYLQEDFEVAKEVFAWAVEAGKRKDIRIAVCGYVGEHNFPSDWSIFRWKTQGGLGGQGEGQGRINSEKEVIWFSPHCLRDKKPESLFTRL